MDEVVIAIYDSMTAAETAVDDLQVARVPSAAIRQFAGDPRAGSDDSVVAVTVEDRHASAVMEILAMQAPVSMTESPIDKD